MKATQRDSGYWSSCCGQKVEYIGFYRCTECEQRALFGGLPVIDAEEAARLRAALAARQAEEDEPCQTLF